MKINTIALLAGAWILAGIAPAQALAVERDLQQDTSRYVPVERYGRIPLPHLFLKTNLLQDVGLHAPGLALEIGLGRRTTLDLSASYAPPSDTKEKHVTLSTARVEFRYWPRERFLGHFLGVHPLFWHFAVGGYEVPSLFERDARYEGTAWGAAFSYGYHWIVARRWSLEFGVSGGGVLLDYDQFDRVTTGDSRGNYKKMYFGLTRACVSLVFMIK
jgi:hypothetical protein